MRDLSKGKIIKFILLSCIRFIPNKMLYKISANRFSLIIISSFLFLSGIAKAEWMQTSGPCGGSSSASSVVSSSSLSKGGQQQQGHEAFVDEMMLINEKMKKSKGGGGRVQIDRGVPIHKPLFCKVHKKESLKFFCNTCQVGCFF